ncbi:MAG: ABC transporter substrate-binding protein [Fibrobacteraceae bacterium]|nr:ABC transporter substrate-binding protein [Fibrobacteraceae bacterium]
MLELWAASCFVGCSSEQDLNCWNGELLPLQHSKMLRIDSVFGEKIVETRVVVGSKTLKNRLVLRDSLSMNKPLPKELAREKVVQVPVKRVVALSTTYLGYMLKLGVQDRIVGVGVKDYIADTSFYLRADSLKMAEVGSGSTINLEKLVALEPDLVITFATGGSNDDYDRLASLNVPLLLTSEWQETSVLAKAEWIKLFGALFGVQNLSDSIFKQINNNYFILKEKIDKLGLRQPRVLAGMCYGGVWYAPGGNSLTAHLIQDAGGNYLFANDSSRELRLNLEEILGAADSADVWINPGAFASAQELLAAEPRVKLLEPWKKNRVYQMDKRKGIQGGNDFYEGAVVAPEKVLQDMMMVINGSFWNDSISKWYRKIYIF